MAKSPTAERANVYARLISTLGLAEKYAADDRGNAHVLASEVATQETLECIEMLEGAIDDIYRKKVLWQELAFWVDHELCRSPSSARGNAIKTLLTKWALRRPDELHLVLFHPNRVQLLVQILEDKAQPARNRAQSARLLAYIGAFDAMPNMQKLVDDETAVAEASSREPETLGSIVGQALKTLAERKRRTSRD